jgi:hypothetical protein
MPDLLSLSAAEVSAFLLAVNKREYLITRAEKAFDQYIAPLDVPGPDQIIDPLLRSAIRPIVGRIYDVYLRELEHAAHPHLSLLSVPAPVAQPVTERPVNRKE